MSKITINQSNNVNECVKNTHLFVNYQGVVYYMFANFIRFKDKKAMIHLTWQFG